MNDSVNQSQDTIDIQVDQTPWYRWRWFFIMSLLFFIPATWLVGLTGDVYGKRKDGVVFQMSAQIKNQVMLIGAILALTQLVRVMAMS